MKEKFCDYPEIISYLDKILINPERNFINLRNCNFCFSLDLEMLFRYLEPNYSQLTYLSFSESDFQKPVDLNLIHQESLNDESGKFIGFKYSKTKTHYNIDFKKCHFFEKVQFSGVHFCDDLDFIDSIFEKEVYFSELYFGKYLRLFNTTFRDNVTFSNMELNEKSIFFTSIENKAKFEGNLCFFNVVFNEAKFWDFVFLKDVIFQNTVFNCPVFFNRSRFNGKTEFSSIETIGMTELKNNVYFDGANIHDIKLMNIAFEKAISFNYATIENVSIDNVHCYGFPLSLVGAKIGNVKDEGTARFLKSEAMKSNDPFLISELNTKEMNLHFKNLNWFGEKKFSDKVILFFNKYSTNFGSRWYQGVAFILLSWVLSFSFIVMLRDGFGTTFILSNKDYLKEALEFLWQFGSIDILRSSGGIVEIIIFLLGKIFIIYGVYQTIAAFRKYGR